MHLGKPAFWKNNKRYYDLKSYWRNLFGCHVHKLAIDADFTCPNRDGKVAKVLSFFNDSQTNRVDIHMHTVNN